jgi:hypothetical protein
MYKLEKHRMFCIDETFIREKNTKVDTRWIVSLIFQKDFFLISLLVFFTHNPLLNVLSKWLAAYESLFEG